MSIYWPTDFEPDYLFEYWTDFQSFIADQKEAELSDLVNQEWGSKPPSSANDFLIRRLKVYSGVENLIENDMKSSPEKLQRVLKEFLPEGFSIKVDCPYCLSRFQTESEVRTHHQEICPIVKLASKN